jgi:hypothetical protein
VLCLLAMAALAIGAAAVRAPANYHRDPNDAAIRAFASGDTRFLAVRGEPVPPGDGPLDRARDIRDLPIASPDDDATQREFIGRYNDTMAKILRASAHGQPIVRSRPFPRALFAVELLFVVAPFMLLLYVRYRLGAYRIGERSWTADFWHPIRYLMPSSYTVQGTPLVRVLRGLLIATVPWILFVLFVLFRGWGPLE